MSAYRWTPLRYALDALAADRKPLRRRTPLRSVGRRGRVAAADMSEARRSLLGRTGGRCDGNDFSPNCTGVGTDAHHIRPADRDENRHDPARMAWLCRPCHQAVHANPTLAHQAGLLVKSWEEPWTN